MLLGGLAAGPGGWSSAADVPAGRVDWSVFTVDSDGDGLDDSLEAGANGGPARAGYDIILRYTNYPDSRDLARLAAYGLEPIYISKAVNAALLDEVPARLLIPLARLPGVEYLEPQPELQFTLDVLTPTLLVRNSTAYSPNTVWEMGLFGEGVNIAIMDSGVNNFYGGIGHESLDDMDDNLLTFDPKFITGVDCLGGVCVPTDPELGDSGHGTHVAGIALGTGGQGPDSQYRGVAPGARLIDVRVGIGASVNIAAVFAGYDWAIANNETDWEFDGDANNGVHILSQSFGGPGGNGQDSLSLAMNEVVEAGIVSVVAAGNSGGGGMGSPAVGDRAITIANINDKNTANRNDDTIAGSSSRGPRASDGDSDVYDEMKPDVGAPGTNINAPAAWSKVGYVQLTGTSMATPAVAGVIALMLEANPELAPVEGSGYEWPLKRILHDTAQDYGGATFPLLSDKYDGAYGWGQVDAYGAVNRALNLKTTTLEGDSLVYSRQAATLRGSLKLIRTPWTSEDDELVYTYTLPSGWGRPTNVKVDSLHETYHDTDIQPQGGGWRLEVTVGVTNPPSSPLNVRVNVSFDSVAPTVTSLRSYDFEVAVELNGLSADAATTSVTVAPAVEPDLAVQMVPPVPAVPNEGEEVTLLVPVSNLGDSDATGRLVVANSTVELVNGTISVAAGSQEAYGAVWNSSGRVGFTTFTATVSEVDPPESDTTNNEASVTVRVNGRPAANLTANVTEARTNEPIRFEGANSTDERAVVAYRFELGDGNQTGWQTTDNHEHAYGQAGEYEARLQVRDDDGWESEWSPPLKIVISGPPVAKLTANLSVSRPGWQVAFNASDSYDTDGEVVEYRFDLDDGNVTDWLEDRPLYEHAYAEPAFYLPKVQVRDDEGLTSKWSDPWAVKVNDRPTANLSANTTSVGQGQPLTFNGSGSEDDSIIEAYRYDLGDGNVTDWQVEPTYEYTYGQPGDYLARLQVVDDDDWESSWSEAVEVHVNAWPVARLTANTSSTRPGWEVVFDGSGSTDPEGDLSDYRYDLGDGLVTEWQTEPLFTHVYSDPGSYLARLQVRDGSGARSGWSEPLAVYVNQQPVAVLEGQPTSLTLQDAVYFDGGQSSDEGALTAYRFDFGDGNVTEWLAEAALSHTYGLSGQFTARLQVRDDYGWASEWSVGLEVQVNPPHRELTLEGPTASLTVKPGLWVTMELNLTNLGEVAERGDFTLEALSSGWQARATPSEYNLDPGARLTLALEVRPWAGAKDGQSETVGLKVQPAGAKPDPLHYSRLLVVSDPRYSLEVSLDHSYLALPAGESGQVLVQVANTGNRPLDPAALVIPPEGWGVALSGLRPLPAGESLLAVLDLTAPDSGSGEPAVLSLEVVDNGTRASVELELVSYLAEVELTGETLTVVVPRGTQVTVEMLLNASTEGRLTYASPGGNLDLTLMRLVWSQQDPLNLNASLEVLYDLEQVASGLLEWESIEASPYQLVLDNSQGSRALIVELQLEREPTNQPSTPAEGQTPGVGGLAGLVLLMAVAGIRARRARRRGVADHERHK